MADRTFDPNRKWTYVEPGVQGPEYSTYTEAQIIEYYFPYWSEQMRKVGKEALISKARCIEDWVVMNWAWEGTELRLNTDVLARSIGLDIENETKD